MVNTIKKILDEKGLGVRKIKRFGSSLDPERFDRHGEGTSDFDFLAVVQATTPLEDKLKLEEFQIKLTSTAERHFIFHHDPTKDSSWDQGREIHLLIAPSWWESDIKKIIADNPSAFQNTGDAFVRALLRGEELFSK